MVMDSFEFYDARGNECNGSAFTLSGDHENRVTDITTMVVNPCSIRRLTPLECERLQGLPDGWTDIGDWTDTKGKQRKTTDTARYRAIGNGIALPFWEWMLRRLCAQYDEPPTMASLFDGIGSFPLIWERINGEGYCLWTSEIEEFPIAVSRKHFEKRGE